MRSPRTSAAPDGFTLIEVALVIGLVAALAGFGMLAGVGAHDAAAFRSERDTLVAALRTARARALSGVGGLAHGVHYGVSGCRTGAACYVIFTGETYVPDSSGEIELPAAPFVEVDWPAVDPVFFAPDGSSGLLQIRLSARRGARTAHVSVNEEGRIVYE